MNSTEKEFAFRLVKRIGKRGLLSDDDFVQLVVESVKYDASLELAAETWTQIERDRERLTRSPGGLGIWTEETWTECKRCPLHKGRTHVVFGRGSVPAEVLVVGEAPGRVEDETGEPFRGDAGTLLDRALRELGDVPYYVTNVVSCRPPKNRNPRPFEVEKCRPRLDETVRAVKPAVVLLVGAQPLYHLLTLGPLGRHRGKTLRWSDHNVTAVATWHPAGILRQRGTPEGRARMRQLREDVRLVGSLVERLAVPF